MEAVRPPAGGGSPDRTARMSRKSQPEWPPPPPGRRGPGRSYNPFYQFEKLARDDGKTYKPPEPRAELWLLGMLGTKTAVRVMTCLLALVILAFLAVLVLRA
jgi:hypothetical protein